MPRSRANLLVFRPDNHFTWRRCETSGNSFNQSKSDRKLKTEDGNPKFRLHANNHGKSETEDGNLAKIKGRWSQAQTWPDSNVVWSWRSNITKIFDNLVSKWSAFVPRRPKLTQTKPNNRDTNHRGQST